MCVHCIKCVYRHICVYIYTLIYDSSYNSYRIRTRRLNTSSARVACSSCQSQGNRQQQVVSEKGVRNCTISSETAARSLIKHRLCEEDLSHTWTREKWNIGGRNRPRERLHRKRLGGTSCHNCVQCVWAWMDRN